MCFVSVSALRFAGPHVALQLDAQEREGDGTPLQRVKLGLNGAKSLWYLMRRVHKAFIGMGVLVILLKLVLWNKKKKKKKLRKMQ